MKQHEQHEDDDEIIIVFRELSL